MSSSRSHVYIGNQMQRPRQLQRILSENGAMTNQLDRKHPAASTSLSGLKGSQDFDKENSVEAAGKPLDLGRWGKGEQCCAIFLNL